VVIRHRLDGWWIGQRSIGLLALPRWWVMTMPEHRDLAQPAPAEEANSEAHVPAKQPPQGAQARVPQADVDEGGSRDHPLASPQGSSPPVGLIWRIRDRETFAAFRSAGIRGSGGGLTVVFVPDAESPLQPPRVAYAIGKKVGSAVVRNRVRRRLRVIFEQRQGSPRPLRPGAYLVVVRPEAGDQTFATLASSVDQALTRIEGRISK